MLQAAAGLDALRLLGCGTRTVPLRTRHTFSGAAYFNFTHGSRSDRVLTPPEKQLQKPAAGPRRRPRAQQPRGGVEVLLVRRGEDVRPDSAARPPAAPHRAASPAVSHARCVISHFIGRGLDFCLRSNGDSG